MNDLEQKKDLLNAFGVMLIVIALCTAAIFMSGCKSIHEARKTTTIDHVRQITVIESYYKDDTGFTMGSQGLGEYYLLKIEGIGL